MGESLRRLYTKEYRTLESVSGALSVFRRTSAVAHGEMVDLVTGSGDTRRGQVLEVDHDHAVVQVFAGTRGVDVETTRARFLGDVARLAVGREMLGRVFDGSGRPLDGVPAIIAEKELEVGGLPFNPFAREHPTDFIQTGFSAIDGLNTLVRGQKLPVFSCFGLPAAEIAAQIAVQAQVVSESEEASREPFAVVFAAVGITHREASYFHSTFQESGARQRTVSFLNLADDPSIERLLTPRLALTTAEYLAFEREMHVLVILTDMIHYAEALREVSTAREEVPGRRGYPGYLYSDLSTIYERAGRLQGKRGSVTQLIILTMPDDDITHPVPDLTGYITEGQIVLSRELHRKGIFPPIDVLPSLSRLMHSGIGAGKTRVDHRNVADQLYASYAKGRDLRRLVAIVGEAALSGLDRRYLEFADRFEQRFLNQGRTARTIRDTLDQAWEILSMLPESELKRISPEYIGKFYRRKESHG
ncbi:MAG TPA: V-type ATP synthase subunit B [Candidatus Acidoferrales bacterium]|nr:V-type ATP synthase subunit B [Candidatus Acidoferrales bacterium]